MKINVLLSLETFLDSLSEFLYLFSIHKTNRQRFR